MNIKFKSKNIDFELKTIGYDEPNNGRELWVADLIINGKQANQLFKHAWNRLNFHLDNYQMSDAAGQFVFIPAEGHAFLLNIHQINQPIYLPYKPLATLQFVGNFFQSDYLVLLYTDETVLLHLYRQTYLTFSQKTHV